MLLMTETTFIKQTEIVHFFLTSIDAQANFVPYFRVASIPMSNWITWSSSFCLLLLRLMFLLNLHHRGSAIGFNICIYIYTMLHSCCTPKLLTHLNETKTTAYEQLAASLDYNSC